MLQKRASSCQPAASPDGRWLATQADPSTLTLWNSQTGSQVFTLPPESGPIWSLAWSPDGERLAVGLASVEESPMLFLDWALHV